VSSAAHSQLSVHHGARVTIGVPGGGEIAALDTAGQERPDAPTVLMLPGYTGSKEDFAPLLDPLWDNGFRAVAVDLPGQYESAGPADDLGYNSAALGAVVAGLVSSLPGPVVLLGHSFGGLVARAAVLAGAPIDGLVLLSSGPAALPPGPRTMAMDAGEPVLRRLGVAAAYAQLESLVLARAAVAAGARPGRWPATELADFHRRRFLASSPAGLIGMANVLRTEPDRTDELAAVLRNNGIGVAVVSGEADDAWGLRPQADMARRLGVSLVLIPGAAHSAAVEQPDRLLRALLPLLRSWTDA
jgi:pimeloyl-ACP methyl ester carboxylesterase